MPELYYELCELPSDQREQVLEAAARAMWSEFAQIFRECNGFSDAEELLGNLLRPLHVCPAHAALRMPCFVALDESTGGLVGACNIVPDDLGLPALARRRPACAPWLSNMVVPPAHRGRGIATRLVQKTLAWFARGGRFIAADVNDDDDGAQLYLWCACPRLCAFYQRFGFQRFALVEPFTPAGHPVHILRRAQHASE